MTTEEFKRDYPQCSHLEGDDLWDAMTNSMLASNIEFEVPLEKPKGPTESYKMMIWDVSNKETPWMELENIKLSVSPKVDALLELHKICADEMFKSVGVPAKYLGGCDPYKESNSIDEVHISEEVGGFWQRIVDKIMKK